jgi:monothiol glutaredoxin
LPFRRIVAISRINSGFRRFHVGCRQAAPEPGVSVKPLSGIAERIIMSADQVHNWIDEQVKNNDVVLFMKGTKDFPQCGFSGRVAQILAYLGLDFKDINVLDDMSVREGVKAYTNWPTIPQLYVKGEFVGGADIITEMFQSGELEQHLNEKGVAVSKAMA